MSLAEQMIDCVEGSGDAKGDSSSNPYFPSPYSKIDEYDEWEVDELLGWTNALNFDELVLNVFFPYINFMKLFLVMMHFLVLFFVLCLNLIAKSDVQYTQFQSASKK